MFRYRSTDRQNMDVKAARSTGSRSLSITLIIGLVLSSTTSCGSGKKIPGVENFHAGVVDRKLYVSFVSTQLHLDLGPSLRIPGLGDSTIGVTPDLQSDGTVFQFQIELNALLDHAGQSHPLAGFPDGRALPDVRGGKLPRWDVELHGLNFSVYLSGDAFGLFVPIELRNKKGLTLPKMVSASIVDERGNRLGKAYAIPLNVGGSGSGLFILLPYLGGAPAGGSKLN